MRIYNTLSGKKELLPLPVGGPLKFFVCGPTVYDYIHIGNGRTFTNYDLIVRYLRSIGVKVFYLQNITDIDDKIIARAAERKTDAATVAKEYEKYFHQDEKALGIKSVTKYARATGYIKQIVRQVQALIEKKHAYKIEGDGYYFDITTFKDYGKLSKRTVGQADDAVSRIDESVGKRNRGDFALWKFSPLEASRQTGEPSWKTTLGEGRPGWHIEDTAITEYHFGPQYDIHGGAIDLIFPHHEAEIAQQESVSGKAPMVKIWAHSGFLNFTDGKMSKSSGQFITVRDFVAKHSAMVFRYLVASHHYRSPLNYSDELVEQVKNTLSGLSQFTAKLRIADGGVLTELNLNELDHQFHAAMADDFNTPEALAVIFNLINQFQTKIWNLARKEARQIEKWITGKLEIFGISLETPKIPSQISKLCKERELFRVSKQFAQSDDLRKQIEALGYTIEDTPKGPFLWPKSQI